ncbi:MAG: hypothetical protein K6G63_06790 [Eubacterium sp.]|nr:hypothetical protein [Eubacterium sp.]
MKTVALRFADNFAPEMGTIEAHNAVINKYGFVWYGKLGAAISQKIIEEILKNNNPKILLIHSGKADRYWAYIENIQHELPERKQIPDYYRDNAGIFKTWFKVTRIESAPNNVLSRCRVVSSHRPLSEVSKSSMSPYFIVEVDGD